MAAQRAVGFRSGLIRQEAAMALPHATSGERIVLLPDTLDDQFHSVALAKTPHLELIRLRLQKGKALPTHTVPGELTLQCLQGELMIDAHGRSTVLHPGEMLFLAGGVPYALMANHDSTALMTILLR
jgi:quercetin dioxygenase-like cupin family protein